MGLVPVPIYSSNSEFWIFFFFLFLVWMTLMIPTSQFLLLRVPPPLIWIYFPLQLLDPNCSYFCSTSSALTVGIFKKQKKWKKIVNILSFNLCILMFPTVPTHRLFRFFFLCIISFKHRFEG